MMKVFLICVCLFSTIFLHAQKTELFTDKTSSGIKELLLSPDGNLLLSLHENNSIQLWDLASQQLFQTFSPAKWTQTAAFSADGKYIAFGNARSSIWVWDITANQLVDSIPCDLLEPRSISFCPTENLLAYAERKGNIKIWSVEQKQLLYETATEPGCSEMLFSPDGKTLAAANSKSIILWDYQSNEKQYLEGHQKRVEKIVFSPDGKKIVTGSHDKKIRFYNAITLAKYKTIEVEYPGENCLCNRFFDYSPDGSLFAYLDPWSMIRVLNTQDWDLVKELDENQITTIIFSSDGNYLIYGLSTGAIKKLLL